MEEDCADVQDLTDIIQRLRSLQNDVMDEISYSTWGDRFLDVLLDLEDYKARIAGLFGKVV